MDQTQQQIRKYVDILLRRKNLLITTVLIAMLAGVGCYLKMPKKYKASALLLYQRQIINATRLSPDIVTRTREMISTMGEQVTSRTSLEKLILENNIYKLGLGRSGLDAVIADMKENISISSSRGDTFRVEYIGDGPERVTQITNALAAKFIEDNIKFREESATETSAYVKDELSMAKKTLDEKEELMRNYKLKYYNEMPQQLETNMSRLNSLFVQLQSNEEGIRDLERTRILIQEQIASRNAEIAQVENERKIIESNLNRLSANGQASSLSTNGHSDALTEFEQAYLAVVEQLKTNKTQLDSLSLKYTAMHPEIKRLKRVVAGLEEKQAEMLELHGDMPVATRPGNTPVVSSLASNQSVAAIVRRNKEQLEQLNLQMKEVSYNIKNLRESGKNIHENIEKYQGWISATPVREAEWTALSRDYDQLSSHYQELVTRNLNAESVESLEKSQKGSQFKIVDPARVPQKPFTPNFIKLMAAAIGIGSALGACLAFLLEFIDSSFKDAMELESFLGLPVVCSIPMVMVQKEKRVERVKEISINVAFAVTTSLIVFGIAYLWQSGLVII